MWREVVVLVFVVGCTTPNPSPMLGEAPKVDDVSVVPAVQSPDEALRDTSAVDTPASPPEPSPSEEIFDPAAERIMVGLGGAAVCDSPASSCSPGCRPLTGMKFDEAKGCYATLTVGCIPPGAPLNSDAVCTVRDDDVVFVGSGSESSRLGSGWGARRCTPEEAGMDGTERRMCSNDKGAR